MNCQYVYPSQRRCNYAILEVFIRECPSINGFASGSCNHLIELNHRGILTIHDKHMLAPEHLKTDHDDDRSIMKSRKYTRTISRCEISTLDHKLWNHSMEPTAFIPKPCLAGTQLLKILSRLGYFVSIETHSYPSSILSADRNIKVHLCRHGGRHHHRRCSSKDNAPCLVATCCFQLLNCLISHMRQRSFAAE